MIVEIANLPSLRCDVCERVTFVRHKAESNEEIVTAAIDNGWTVQDNGSRELHLCITCTKIDRQPWNETPMESTFLDMPPEDPALYRRRS